MTQMNPELKEASFELTAFEKMLLFPLAVRFRRLREFSDQDGKLVWSTNPDSKGIVPQRLALWATSLLSPEKMSEWLLYAASYRYGRQIVFDAIQDDGENYYFDVEILRSKTTQGIDRGFSPLYIQEGIADVTRELKIHLDQSWYSPPDR